MRGYGIGYVQAERIIRHHTMVHWRRFGWLGGTALALLMADIGCQFANVAGPATALLLAGASLCTGLQLWLAQRAAYPAILQEATDLRDAQRERSPAIDGSA